VAAVERLAQAKGCTSAQLALAWVMAQGDDVVPIPGTKRRRYLEENAAAADVALSHEELRALTDLFPTGAASGERYPPAMMQLVNR
jgi:aryl-alcohol dehydrogenase-like predicted oxidoreductase